MKKLSLINKFVLWGFLFGMLFPAITILLDLYRLNLSLSWESIVYVHGLDIHNFIIDSAPLVIAFVAYIVGRIVYNKVSELNTTIETQIEILEDSNEELKVLNDNIEEQKQIIYHREKRLSTIIESMGEGFGITDMNDVFVFANSSLERIFETEPEGLIGRSLSDFHRDEDIESNKMKSSNLPDEGARTYELEIRTAKHNFRWISVTLTFDYDDHDNIIGRIGIVRDITEARKNQEIIKKKNLELNKYFTAIEQSPTTIVITDLNANIEYANAQFEYSTGYSIDEALGKNPRILNSGHTPKETFDNLWKTLLEGNVWHGEFVNKKKTGEEYIEKAIIAPIKNENGDIINYIAVKEDITDLQEAIKTINRNNEQMKVLINNLPVFIYFKDNELKYKLVNGSFAKVFDIEPDKLIGKSDIELNHPEAEIHQKLDNQIIETGQAILNIESEYIDRNGNKYWASTSKVPYCDETGKVMGILGIVQDITHIKDAERAIRESEEKYRLIADNTSDNIWKMDIETQKFNYVSPSVEAMKGFTSEEAMQFSLSDTLTPESYLRAVADIKKAFEESKQGVINFVKQYQQYRKDGSIIDIETSATFIRDKDGIPIEILGVTRDISERVRNEKELQRLYAIQKQSLKLEKQQKQLIEDSLTQKSKLVSELELIKSELEKQLNEKDKFFSILAHDMKNPFTGFLGLTSLLAEDNRELSNEEITKISTTLNNGAKQLFTLLENLLEWSRLKTGRTEIHPTKLNIKSLISNITDLFADNCKSKKIELITEYLTEEYGYADSYSINMILRNLLSNAIKFSFPENKIIITLNDYDTNSIKIAVKDFGTGISEEDLPKLFRVDVKFTNPGTNKEKGTGLGLLLCKEYIEKSGGELFVNSEVGEGTTFTFTLPKYTNQPIDIK